MRLEGMIRKVITFYPVWSSDNSSGLCGPTMDEAIAGIGGESLIDSVCVASGGIPSLALKKKENLTVLQRRC
jgi:hypothetical protein